jgi:hypothetical protein
LNDEAETQIKTIGSEIRPLYAGIQNRQIVVWVLILVIGEIEADTFDILDFTVPGIERTSSANDFMLLNIIEKPHRYVYYQLQQH